MAYSEQLRVVMRDVVDRIPVTEITRRTGLHRSTIYQWLAGNVPRDLQKITHFCQSLDLSADLRQAFLEATGIPIPNRKYDFDEEDEAPAVGPVAETASPAGQNAVGTKTRADASREFIPGKRPLRGVPISAVLVAARE